ncbi:hypothetical protein CTI12_AA093200 [Artemisia annua]|uniref:NAC domain-containing protein n=1 Tax=Artemisia annua TaxID=35608 RepID=A0A2U1PZN3_ARTAN|nr:hypothetical protein CTI12_AA093200 [Artemisia annua]
MGKPYSFKANFVAFVNRQQLTGDVHMIRSLPFSLTGTWQKSSPVDVVLSYEDFSLIRTKQKYRFVPNNPTTISHWKMHQFETVNPPNSNLVICVVHNDEDLLADKAKDEDTPAGASVQHTPNQRFFNVSDACRVLYEATLLIKNRK